MSNDSQKADQIAYRFYTKLTLVVNSARATAEPKPQAKVDKWFNLETPDSDLFREHLRIYRSVSTSPPPPPLELQVLLSIPELTNNQVLVHLAPDSSRVRIDPTPRHILLETWLLKFTPTPQHQYRHEEDRPDVAPPTIYKHGIPLFRSLYSLLRILPTWKLYKRLRRRMGGTNRNGNLGIQLCIGNDSPAGILGFNSPTAPNSSPLPIDTHVFPAIPHPLGSLSLSATYLTSPNFQLDELESLLSSRFLSLDEGPEFTPTLAKNQQRDSLSGSPGSLPIRTALPRSPPSSIADKFVLPVAHSRTTSLPGSVPSTRSLAPPISRVPSVGPSTSSVASSSRQDSSSAWSKDEGRLISGIAARARKESTGAGRGADLPSAPSPLPIRRPNINPVHPFKSSTLSSGSPSVHSPSPSLRQPSPLSSTGLPSRPTPTSPTSSRVPPSPIGMGSRPSPPLFAPSSLGDKRSLGSAEGEEPSPKPVGRKRYSSSFGHRYAASGGAGSEGSAGSGERREGERVGSASFLSTNTDDDDISVFVQDIDARKPLSGNRRRESAHEPLQSQHRQDDPDMTPVVTRQGTASGPMLTSESEVDEKLKEMNETFLASLEGLGGGGSSKRIDRPHGEGGSPGDRNGSGGEVVHLRRRTSAGNGGNLHTIGRGRGRSVIGRPGSGSGSASGSDMVLGTGIGGGSSDEIIGKMELDDERRRSRGY